MGKSIRDRTKPEYIWSATSSAVDSLAGKSAKKSGAVSLDLAKPNRIRRLVVDLNWNSGYRVEAECQ